MVLAHSWPYVVPARRDRTSATAALGVRSCLGEGFLLAYDH
jgi:hypothetical protein